LILEALRQNAQVISALASVGGFLIWATYALLFYRGFRRQRSSHIFIHAAGDGGPGTECLVINLSPEPVHILCSIATSENQAVQIQAPDSESVPIKARVKQGPLETGESLCLGKFDDIFHSLLHPQEQEKEQEDDANEQTLEIRVAAIHGLDDKPIGATRSFIFMRDKRCVIPAIPYTVQKRSRRQAREVKQWMEQCGSYRN
jgi:hypothetical protein